MKHLLKLLDLTPEEILVRSSTWPTSSNMSKSTGFRTPTCRAKRWG